MNRIQDTPCSLVVPCFNEAQRLDRKAFETLCRQYPNISVYFVNDGSSDETETVLQSMLAKNPSSMHVISLTTNSGKAEACRRGLNQAINDGGSIVGYWDADLSTPLNQVPLLLAEVHKGARMVLGSRVNLLGREIRRTASRHYLGRCFATVASMVLGIAVYDTQCGAKLFKVDETLKQSVHRPFSTGWIFDVELIARLLQREPEYLKCMVEFPLHHWCDVAGSKVKPHHFFTALLELVQVWIRYRR